MKPKRLNWKYEDDYFLKKSDIAEKVFIESDTKITSPSKGFQHRVDLGFLDYDVEA